MSNNVFCALPLAIAYIGVASTALAEVSQSYTVRYYEVPYGEYQQRQLVQYAPSCLGGKRAVGCTIANLRWDYKYRQNQRCSLTELRITVGATIYLPSIPDQVLASNPILQRSMDALMRHEEGHFDFSVQSAYKLEREIMAIDGRFRSCAEVVRFIDETGKAVSREAQHRNEQYDVETNSGGRDGAVF